MGELTFISYAREDAAWVLRLAASFEARNLPIWIDQRSIPPGVDWDRAIDEGLRRCTTLLIILSPDAVKSNEVRAELRTALNTRKRIVPVLYRACEVFRELQNIQYVDFSDCAAISETGIDSLALTLRESTAQPSEEPRESEDTKKYRQPTAIPIIAPPNSHSYPSRRELRNRRDVLTDVKSECVNRLAQSVQTRALIAVRQEMRFHDVVRAWDGEIKISHLQRSLPSLAAGLLEHFNHSSIAGKLLILGAPGSGKTTALVELAHELVLRAEHDFGEPMPVLLSLSSWSTRLSIADWLVDELKLKYGIRKDYSTKWRNERCLTPLLDGLDELPPTRQEACVQAINLFLHEYRPPHAVVCCRLAEYDNFETNLHLNGAICLLPFDDDQIREFLTRAGCRDLWTDISAEPESLELARSPLLLGMMTAAHDEMQAWQQAPSASQRRAYLFDLYTRHLLSRQGVSELYSMSQTVRWLARLAAMLQRQGQSEFLLERIQPYWLHSTAERWLYRIGVVSLTAVLVYLAQGATNRIIGLIPAGAVGQMLKPFVVVPSLMDHVAMIGIPLAVGLIVAARSKVVPIETLRWSTANARVGVTRWLRKAASSAVGFGAYVGIATGALVAQLAIWGGLPGVSTWDTAASPWSKAGVLAGAAAGGLAAVTLVRLRPTVWLTGLVRSERTTTTQMKDVLITGLLYGSIAGVCMGLPMGFMFGPLSGLAIALIMGPIGLLSDRSRVGFVRSLTVAAVSGLTIGLITSQLGISYAISSGQLVAWGEVWLFGGLGVGTALALLVATHATRKPPIRSDHEEGTVATPSTGSRRLAVTWARWCCEGMIVGVVSGLIASVLMRFGYLPMVKGVALLLSGLGNTLLLVLSIAAMSIVAVSIFAALMAGLVGALFGVLGGFTGPDVERRAVPNQGIRRSAANVPVFAVMGVLIIGVPYGLINLLAAVVITRTSPDVADWLRLGLGSALSVGILGGLLPGAACIQHFTLRLVFWCTGFTPRRYTHFLDYATERLFLQRIGGRYRFIHVLLRDHFAGMQESPLRA